MWQQWFPPQLLYGVFWPLQVPSYIVRVHGFNSVAKAILYNYFLFIFLQWRHSKVSTSLSRHYNIYTLCWILFEGFGFSQATFVAVESVQFYEVEVEFLSGSLNEPITFDLEVILGTASKLATNLLITSWPLMCAHKDDAIMNSAIINALAVTAKSVL